MGIEQLFLEIGHRSSTRSVAPDADLVPFFRQRLRIWWANESIVALNPALLQNQPGEWETNLLIPIAAGKPENLKIMGTGNHSHRDSQRWPSHTVGAPGSLDLIDN